MSDDRIAEIRARLDAATSGPWVEDNGDVMTTGNTHHGPIMVALDCDNEGDAPFIANAPADIAWLLDEVDAARERIALLRAEVDDLDRIRRMYQEVKS